MLMPAPVLPEMTLRAPAAVPPMVLFGPLTVTPSLLFGMAAVPALFVPMELPATTLPAVPAPRIQTLTPGMAALPSAMTFPAPAPVPPIVLPPAPVSILTPQYEPELRVRLPKVAVPVRLVPM